jgi:hypothetical protein
VAITIGHGTAGETIAMAITTLEFFPIKLCTDIIQREEPLKSDMLRFHLCTEDITDILNDTNFLKIVGFNKAAMDIDLLKKISLKEIPRRKYSVLGQSVLKRFSSMKHFGIELYFIPSEFQFSNNLVDINHQYFGLKKQVIIVIVPEDYDDWEDDYAFNDDVQFECDC